MKKRIRTIYEQRKGIYGYRRIQAELLRQFGCRVNHKKVLRIMQNLGLKSIIRRKRVYMTTYQAKVRMDVLQIIYSSVILPLKSLIKNG
ncbi:IS3 family transposase [Brevibacillus laterosporus]|uniref:Putative transposase OrfB n=1 Tax=Brevibacillus laterosporus LMG 15441 TaxID=1042163 RepID=A0A075R423_BRELA|nr:IS3 family transposase [Brevibacillus laterosporus]AIG26604.1 putative transposase OrfB [Brevibacillus laterosporus LMG 15441]